VVLVDVEEEAAALGERRHVAGALRGQAHGGAVQRLELRADRLVEVEEYQHGRLGRRGPRLRRRRGRGPRHHRSKRPLAAGHGRRRRHPAAGAVAVSSSVGEDGDSATALSLAARDRLGCSRLGVACRLASSAGFGPQPVEEGGGVDLARGGFSGVSFARCALKSILFYL
jgi:hypothetical protein